MWKVNGSKYAGLSMVAWDNSPSRIPPFSQLAPPFIEQGDIIPMVIKKIKFLEPKILSKVTSAFVII